MNINSRYFKLVNYSGVVCRVQIKEEWFNTRHCLVTNMHALVYEALELAEKHSRIISFSYLGLPFKIWPTRTKQPIIVEMVRVRTSQFLRKPLHVSPSFLTSTSWLEAVRTFYQGSTEGAVHLAIKFSTVLMANSKNEFLIKRNLDATLTRYWNLIVFFSSQEEIDNALVILSLAWKRDVIGERICDWRADQIQKVHGMLGLIETNGRVSIVTKASNQ